MGLLVELTFFLVLFILAAGFLALAIYLRVLLEVLRLVTPRRRRPSSKAS